VKVAMQQLAHDDVGVGSPPMMLIHGWCCNRSLFAPQVECFSAVRRVVAVDLPGHGSSGAGGEYTIEALAGEVAALGSALGLEGSIVVGHSLGSMVALALARRAPELVAAIVMIDPPPLNREVWAAFATELIPSLQAVDDPAARRRFVEQMFLPTDDADRREQIIEIMCAVPNDVAIPLIEAMATFDSSAALRECAVPLLTIGAATPTNSTRYLLETNPRIAIGQTVGAGHFNHLEVPEQVNPMIERFMSTIG
jgi:pimeloyl-ACP methyl ester carboxylesterase